jgi:FMN phosphatase YigB (HAD superfamily)
MFGALFLSSAGGVMQSDAMGAITSETISVISFDVFDTLVRRTVQKPEDVFAMAQDILQKKYSSQFPEFFLWRFAELRQAAERRLRQNRDLTLSSKRNSASEEITIQEVYVEMAACVGARHIDVDLLIEVEQAVEFSVLRPRQAGKRLYEAALAHGKRIVLTSDFIHPVSFIEHVLEQCGYDRFETIFLSSAIGRKKHSGKLFDVVVDACHVPASAIVHIGDNPVGDVKRAKARGLHAVLLPSARHLAKTALAKRKITMGVFDRSFMLRAVLSQFSNRYLDSMSPRQRPDEGAEQDGSFALISTREEFGYLVLGPMMYAFSNWIIDQALAEKKTQILFFARDSILAFRMCEAICEKRGLLGALKLVYVPTSRKSVTGLDLTVPEDLLKVRIDDFTATATLGRLLSERFMIHAEDVSPDLLKRWGVANLNVEKRSIPLAMIYGLVLDVARCNWNLLGVRYARKRELFTRYLDFTSKVDFDAPTAAVDFGYQGSIHRKVGRLFSTPLLPLFFITYANGFGREPIEAARAFYAENENPLTRSNVCITHNLVLETLLNEGKGSVSEIAQMADGQLEIMRNTSVSPAHAKSIEAIHEGAIGFCRDWLEECLPLETLARFEADSLAFFFALVMRQPTRTEIALLGDLMFDNGFAGVGDLPIIGMENGAKTAGRIVWPEALALLRDGMARKSYATKSSPAMATIIFYRRPLVPLVRYFVARLGNELDLEKFDDDPAAFFENLTDARYRRAGRLLFPPRRE